MGVLILAGDLVKTAIAPAPFVSYSQPMGYSDEGKEKGPVPFLPEIRALLKSVCNAEKGSCFLASGPRHLRAATDKSKEPHKRDESRD